MSFRLVPNSVTLNDLEGRNSPNRCVISPNSVAFWADNVKVVEDTPIYYAAAMLNVALLRDDPLKPAMPLTKGAIDETLQ